MDRDGRTEIVKQYRTLHASACWFATKCDIDVRTWKQILENRLMTPRCTSDIATYPKKCKKVCRSGYSPKQSMNDDDNSHRLYDIHLHARQLDVRRSSSRRRLLLLLDLSSVLTTWDGCYGNALTTTCMTTDHFALTSDDVKDSPVAVDEEAHRQKELN